MVGVTVTKLAVAGVYMSRLAIKTDEAFDCALSLPPPVSPSPRILDKYSLRSAQKLTASGIAVNRVL